MVNYKWSIRSSIQMVMDILSKILKFGGKNFQVISDEIKVLLVSIVIDVNSYSN